jgi:hypothetical protein
MRKTHVLFAGASVVLLSACGRQSKSAIDADLRKDLELASSDNGILLGNGAATSGQQFVSSIERTTPPAKSVAKSARVKRHRPAPKAPPQMVQTEAPAAVTESEIQSVATAPTAIESEAPVTARPQPMAVSYPNGPSSVGSDGGGSIFGAVIRGGVVGDVDHCDPRRTRRSGPIIAINSQIPFPVGGSGLGRVSIPRSGGVSIGRSMGRASVGRASVGRVAVGRSGNVGRGFPR